jgi:hypothetical protein
MDRRRNIAQATLPATPATWLTTGKSQTDASDHCARRTIIGTEYSL